MGIAVFLLRVTIKVTQAEIQKQDLQISWEILQTKAIINVEALK